MRRLYILLIVSILSMGVTAQQRKTTTAGKSRTTQTAKKKTAPAKPVRRTGAANGRKTTDTKKENVSVKGLQNQRQQLQKQIKEQERRLRSNEQDVKKRLANLMVINSEIADKRKTIDTIRRDIKSLDGDIVTLNEELDTLQKQLEDRKQKYVKSMRYMHRNRSLQNQLMFVFSAKNFTQMYRRLRFMREYASYQRAQGDAVKTKQGQVTRKREELTEVKRQKSSLLSRGEEERKLLESKQAEQENVVSSLKKQQKTIQSVIEQQRKKDAALNAQIDRLIAEEIARAKARAEAEARKKAAEEAAARKREEELARKKAAEAASKATGNKKKAVDTRKTTADSRKTAEATKTPVSRQRTTEVFTVSSEDRRISGNFESNRGRLPMPITGPYRIITHLGQRNVEGLSNVRLDSKGIDLKGQAGALARCVFDGEVTGVYGIGGTMVVMVRHGSYISVYCNLVSVNVHRGQQVTTRQTLGKLGTENILHFQLRKEKAVLNPESWLGR